MPKDVHPNKKYRTFEAFYPFYLGEHSHPTNKTLHVIGTTIIVGIGLFYPFTICPALLFAGSIGYFIMYLTYNLPHGMKCEWRIYYRLLRLFRILLREEFGFLQWTVLLSTPQRIPRGPGFVELGCMMGAFNVIMYIMEGGFGWWTVVPFIGMCGACLTLGVFCIPLTPYKSQIPTMVVVPVTCSVLFVGWLCSPK
jgi:hypothetical protein